MPIPVIVLAPCALVAIASAAYAYRQYERHWIEWLHREWERQRRRGFE